MGVVSSLFSTPKMAMPPPPPAPPPQAAPPTRANAQAGQAVNRARAGAAATQGGTIATGPQGLSQPPDTAKSTLLGQTSAV